MFLEQRTGKKYLGMFKPIDWVALVVFTYLFYIGVIGLLYGGFLGGLILFVTWELWTKYLKYRQNNP